MRVLGYACHDGQLASMYNTRLEQDVQCILFTKLVSFSESDIHGYYFMRQLAVTHEGVAQPQWKLEAQARRLRAGDLAPPEVGSKGKKGGSKG